MNSYNRADHHADFLSGLVRTISRHWKRWKSSLRADHYRPEKHYMRGPGPRAKHGSDGGGSKTPGSA
jgi:hypothetical protein